MDDKLFPLDCDSCINTLILHIKLFFTLWKCSKKTNKKLILRTALKICLENPKWWHPCKNVLELLLLRVNEKEIYIYIYSTLCRVSLISELGAENWKLCCKISVIPIHSHMLFQTSFYIGLLSLTEKKKLFDSHFAIENMVVNPKYWQHDCSQRDESGMRQEESYNT